MYFAATATIGYTSYGGWVAYMDVSEAVAPGAGNL